MGMLRNRLSPQRTSSTCHSRAPHLAHSFSRQAGTRVDLVRSESRKMELEREAEGGERGCFYTFQQPSPLTKRMLRGVTHQGSRTQAFSSRRPPEHYGNYHWRDQCRAFWCLSCLSSCPKLITTLPAPSANEMI
jgi:hypothetical protein